VAAKSRPSPLPRRIGLQLARLVKEAPEGRDWLHEVKFDGYRVLIWKDGARVRITSRGGQDWSGKLPDMVRSAQALRCDTCILDGELITLDAHRISNFGLLQQRFGDAGGEAKLCVMVFDLLFLDGRDLRPLAQIERKEQLAALFKGVRGPLVLTSYRLGKGPEAARAACREGLEGIVAKRSDAPYTGDRSGSWLKIKCVDSEEFAIIAYTRGLGARESLGSLLLGAPDASGRWRYFGRVGTGLDERTIKQLLARLKKSPQPIALANRPTRVQLRGATPIWVKPQLVVEVEFRGYTEDGLLRQASLKGVREDRSVDTLRPQQRNAAPVSSPRARAAAAEP